MYLGADDFEELQNGSICLRKTYFKHDFFPK